MISEKKYIKWGCMLLSGLLFITTALITYIPLFVENFGPEIELTLISNLFAGILFFCGGVYGITKEKEFPQVVYMDSVVLLQLVFLICMAFIGEFNFSGAFVFLHIVNPILATLELLLFTAHDGKPTVRMLLSSIAFPACYLIYVMIYGFLSGNWIYGILNIQKQGLPFVLLFVFIACIGILLLVYLQYKISSYVSKRINK